MFRLVDESRLVSSLSDIFVVIMFVYVSNHPLLAAAAIPFKIWIEFSKPGFLALYWK